jgi:acyl-CoA thioesterase-1
MKAPLTGITTRRATFGVAALLLVWALLASAQPGAPVLLIVGDSISAAYGLDAPSGWTQLLQARLEAAHYRYRVVNASITGDTTAGGRARLPALLQQYRPAIVVIELGGNDGLRGGDLNAMRNNLEAMVAAAQKAGAQVLLVGMRLPPNYGLPYTQQFAATFQEVARERRIPAVPFLFDGFAENDEWFQPDRIHPTAAAQPRLLSNVWPALKPLLDKRR